MLCLAPEEGLGVRDEELRAKHLDEINGFRGRLSPLRIAPHPPISRVDRTRSALSRSVPPDYRSQARRVARVAMGVDSAMGDTGGVRRTAEPGQRRDA